MLEPYIRMLKPLEPSRLYSEQVRHERNTLPYTLLEEENEFDGETLISRNAPAFTGVKDLQSVALRNILESGEKSDYGQRYHFDGIRTMEGWSSRLPLTNYDTYQPMINLSIRIDESGIFTDDEITAYALNYGNFGTSKRLPFTKRHLDFYVAEFKKKIKNRTVFMMLESLPYRASGLDLDTKYTNTLMGLILSEVQKSGITDIKNRMNFVKPVELLFPDEVLNADYVRLFFALSEKNVEVIYAPNAWTTQSNLEMLFSDYERLCNDIEAGHISETEKFPDTLRETLNKRVLPDKKLAEELSEIFKNNSPHEALKKIWPNLQEVICNCSGSYQIYADSIKNYFPNTPISNTFFATEEALIGYAQNDNKFELALGAAFFEFVPINDKSKILYAHQLIKGEIYHILISSMAGLYRYKTRAIIKVEELTENSLIFSAVCERVYGDITEERIYEIIKKCDMKIQDFVFFYDDDTECYTLILEPVDVMFNEPGTHVLYREILQYKRNILPDALRPVHVTDSPSAIKFFKKMTMEF